MKQIILSVAALALSVAVFAQGESSDNLSNGNYYAGKNVAVIATGHQIKYDANKRTWQRSGNQVEAIAQSNNEVISGMLKMYGANVFSPYDRESRILQQVVDSMDGDTVFSTIQETAISLGVDYVLWEDLVWMLYAEQLFIYEYQVKMLDVASNTVDISSAHYYLNAYKDRDTDAATTRINNGHIDQIKEIVARITPPIYAATALSKNGKTADVYTVTRSGYYRNDIFRAYKVGAELKNLNGNETAFLTLTPLGTSTKIELEDPKYIITFDNKLEIDPAMIICAGDLFTANIPGFEYKSIPIILEPLEGANEKTYDSHNKEVTNYALFNAIHKNKALSVIANSQRSAITPQFECKLSEYSETKNIVKVKLTITDLTSGAEIKNVSIESHTSNIDDVIAAQVNEVFGTPVTLGNVDKKTISFFVDMPIAFNEEEKFMLSIDDENHTPIVVYDLVKWKGMEYVFSESKVLDKKANGNIGKDPEAKYILTRYVETPKDPKKDNSEFKKVASTNKMMDLMGK